MLFLFLPLPKQSLKPQLERFFASTRLIAVRLKMGQLKHVECAA